MMFISYSRSACKPIKRWNNSSMAQSLGNEPALSVDMDKRLILAPDLSKSAYAELLCWSPETGYRESAYEFAPSLFSRFREIFAGMVHSGSALVYSRLVRENLMKGAILEELTLLLMTLDQVFMHLWVGFVRGSGGSGFCFTFSSFYESDVDERFMDHFYLMCHLLVRRGSKLLNHEEIDHA
ncbi:hypothetical protein Tco_1081831 [Tanacetum coccineum]|uniref:Uncharacterized protein n=1 Tax=Tanacetum coccineum TaxID=301880 RepID=A0ABQ5HYK6_9ASTR